MPTQDFILVDVIQSVVNSMVVPNPDGGNFYINYEPGRSSQIIASIVDLDNSITMKGLKYPLLAMVMPIRESRGVGGFYGKVTIPRIVIATLTKSGEGNETVLSKYDSSGTFKKVLYPLYNEFFKRLAQSPNVNCSDPYAFVHDKMDNPGQQAIQESTTDYIDSIEILNLEFILLQSKSC